MRRRYSTLLAIVIGILITLLSALFALIGNALAR